MCNILPIRDTLLDVDYVFDEQEEIFHLTFTRRTALGEMVTQTTVQLTPVEMSYLNFISGVCDEDYQRGDMKIINEV